MDDDKKYTVIEFDRIVSTSVKAKELVEGGVEPWTVVVAKQQAGGYGRKGGAWFSPAGGLYFSVVLPASNVDDLQIMTILAAFCAASVIKEQFGVELFVKLPNDVYLNGKKVCGVLTENIIFPMAGEDRPQGGGEVRSSVIGIGVNTNIESFPDDLAGATSLAIELGQTIDNNLILEQIISQLQKTFRAISQ
jgi:BirA family biotin operon repressor/biotin-[acetyl-CoA-carboxylase] ligase